MQTALEKNSISNFTESADIETSSEGYAGRFSGKIGKFFLSVQSEITLDLLKPYEITTVLDTGGGHGQLAVPLVEKGYKVTVTGSADVCRENLDRLLPPSTFEYLTCDLLNQPFSDDHFDAVVAFRLLPHVNEWEKLLDEMCRVSKNVVIFDYPDIRSFNFLNNILFSTKKKIEGNTRTFRLFRRKEVMRVLKKNSFGQIKLKPQFFVPMVVHRIIKNYIISNILETIFKYIGVTYLFGSPIIVKASKF